MKYTLGCLDGKNIDIDGVKVDCGELAKVWDMVRDSLWNQIEDGVRKKAEAEKEAEAKEEDSADEVEEFTANDARMLSNKYNEQEKKNKDALEGCIAKIKDCAATTGKNYIVLEVCGLCFNYVRYELVRLGFTVSPGRISGENDDSMNFTASW